MSVTWYETRLDRSNQSLIFLDGVRRVRSRNLWINDTTWLCRNHLASVKLPAALDACWYDNCTSIRPENRPAKVSVIIPPTRPAFAGSPDMASPSASGDISKVAPNHFEKAPATPSQVACQVCQKALRRKPSEITGNKSGVFFCGREHQDQYKSMQVRQPVAVSPIQSQVVCQVCRKALHRKPSEIAKNKSGVFFCGREHQDQYGAQQNTTSRLTA